MPFLINAELCEDIRIRKHRYNQCITLKRKSAEKIVILQAQINLLTNHFKTAVKGRASAFASEVHGSFTAEASLVMTLFLLSVYGILYFFLILHVQVVLQQAAEQVTEEMAQYGYAQEHLLSLDQISEEWASEAAEALKGGIQLGVLAQGILKEASIEYLEHSVVDGGSGGIGFAESSVMAEDGMIDMVLRYQVTIPAGFPGVTRFQIVQRSRKRAWIGSDGSQMGGNGEEQEEEKAYVTENGSVYHLYADCTHIKLSVEMTEMGTVGEKRNENGGRYGPCEKCCKADLERETVYITKEGDRYHSTLGCSGLKRSVTVISLEEAQSMALCSRCEARRKEAEINR